MLRAIGYIRVSSELQKDNSSLSSQRSSIAGYAERMDMQLVCVREDVQSGADDTRPGFLRVLEDFRAGVATVLIVHDMDRFTRDLEQWIGIRNELQRLNISLHSALDGQQSSSLLVTMRVLIAEEERRKIIERTDRGRREKLSQGQIGGYGSMPYGLKFCYQERVNKEGKPEWVVVGAEIDEERAEVVRLIFRLYTIGPLC